MLVRDLGSCVLVLIGGGMESGIADLSLEDGEKDAFVLPGEVGE